MSLNRGIAESKCDIIARMDGDDVSLRDRFEEQLRVLDQNAEVDFCHSNFQEIDENGGLLSSRWQRYGDLPTEWLLLWTNPIAHPSVMFRRSILPADDEIFKGEYYPAEDYELWSRISLSTRFHHIDRPLIRYRRVSTSAYQSQPRKALLMSLKANLQMVTGLIGGKVPDFHQYLTTFAGALEQRSVRERYSVLSRWYIGLAGELSRRRGWREHTVRLVARDVERRLEELLRSERGIFNAAGSKADLLRRNPFRMLSVGSMWLCRPAQERSGS